MSDAVILSCPVILYCKRCAVISLRLSSPYWTATHQVEENFVLKLFSLSQRIQRNPGNSNSEEKQKTVRVSGVSSYRGRLKYPILQVNNY